MRLVSLFSGGGGWEAGAVELGIKPVMGVEFVPWIAKLYAHNFDDRIKRSDVREVAGKLPLAEILVSSPPCQDYSLSGKAQAAARKRGAFRTSKSRFLCDPRIGLYTLDAVDAVRPALVLIENAKQYATDPSSVLPELEAGLRERGYRVEHRVLKAWEYGVPSGRERTIVIASRSTPRWPRPTKPKGWWQALHDLTLKELPLAPYHKWHLGRRAPPASSYPVMLSGSTSGMNRVRLIWRAHDDLGWTATTGKSASSARVLMSPTGPALRMTPRAWARLQGWPDWYDFSAVSDYDALTVIGNSMAPELARRLIAANL